MGIILNDGLNKGIDGYTEKRVAKAMGEISEEYGLFTEFKISCSLETVYVNIYNRTIALSVDELRKDNGKHVKQLLIGKLDWLI